MKNLFKSLLSFVAVAALFVACDPENQPQVPAGTRISVDQTNIVDLPAQNVPAVTINVTADGEWLATSPSWISIDPSHASASTTVTIKVADNVDADGKLQGPRSGKITLTLVDADVSAEITVEQQGNAALDTRRTYVKVTEVTSGKAYLLVVKKADDSYNIPILFGPTGTYGYPKPKVVTLEEDGSIKMDDASNGLIFTDAGRDMAYTIQQPDGRYIWREGAYNTWSCADDPKEGNLWKIDHVYDDGTVRITALDNGAILQYGHGGFDSFAAYSDMDENSILPWLYEDTKAAEIDDSKCFFPTTNVKVAADSVKATFAVTANIPWELTKTEGDWITDFTPKSGDADATVTVTFPANTADGAEARVAKFHLASTDGNKSADLTLTQASPAVFTLADVLAGENGEYTVKNVVVVAVGGSNRIVADASGYMLAYGNASGTTAPKLGDKADITGNTKDYNGVKEWDKPTYTVTANNTEFKHPEAVVLDIAGLKAYAEAPVVEYAVVEGVRNESTYVVLEVGEEKFLVNVYGDMTTETGKTYKAYGYAIGYDTNNKKMNFVVTSYEEVKPNYAKFELSATTAEVEPAAGAATFQVVADDNVAWTLAIEPAATVTIEGLEPNVMSASGTKNVTINYAANTNAAPVNYVVTVAAAADAVVENPKLTFTLTQKAPEGAEALKFEWRNEADTLVNVAFNAEGAAHWYIEKDAAVEYELQVLAGNGSVYTESGDGITIEKEANHVAINYGKNTENAERVWTVVATTRNENVANKILTAKLVQGAYEYSDLAEFNAAVIAANGKELTLIVDVTAGVEITKITGSNVFAQNSTGGVLLYGTGLESKGMDANGGHTIKGKFTVKAKTYKGLPEITAIVSQSEGASVGTWGGNYPCFTRTIKEIEENYPKFVNAKCKIVNPEVVKPFGKTKAGEIKDASGSLAIYNYSTDLTVDVPVGAKAEYVIVWPTVYNNHQLGFYKASQFKIQSIPGQIVMPQTLSVVAGEEGKSLGATAPYGGTITFESSDETKATVTSEGVVTGVAAGTATITASVPATTVSFLGADIPVTAATATCEVTVTDAGQGGGETPEPEVDPYSIDLQYVLGSNAYDDGKATINGTADVKVLKIGTSSAKGEFTVVIPAGTKKITYYAVGWKGKTTTLDFQIGGASAATQAVAANDGATGSSPFTITVTDSDKYEIVNDFAADTRVTVTTTTNARAILWGLKAE
ncbi:MAG: Ig-like domain-containing protein [Bacteroidales bacterium]|nr:Ig-like domain-containing protein [Bacteroidales bacterium]